VQEDNTLMDNFQAGDHESFERLIVKHLHGAVLFAQKYVHDYHTAEDIAQESFADIYVNRHRYKDKYSFKTYLFTIIKNKSIDHLRKKISIPLESIKDLETITTEELVLDIEQKGVIRKALNNLKEDYRKVIYLFEFEGFSYEEISGIMGKNLGQIKILIYRARKKLKIILEKEV
jgi:RNA polymerase sigma factor (sigma-70 family)